MDQSEVIRFVESQTSLHLYKNVRAALVDILSRLPSEQFENIRKNLIVMAFHQGAVGQVMHFDARSSKFAVMQLYIPKNMPDDVLRWVIAHELGHVMQGRNWQESDGMKLEDDATDFATSIGLPKTKEIKKWLDSHKT